MTDLLIMSSLNTKTPAVTPGAGDLLDTLVQDHLDRAAPAPSEVASSPDEASGLALAGAIEAALAADVAPAPAAPAGIAADAAAPASDDLLKREIETLLRGNAEDSAPVERVPTPAFSDTAPALPRDEEPAALSQAELQTLLPEEAPATPAIILASGPAAPLADHAQQVTEAEDLLAAELAQLMAEAQPAIASETARVTTAPEPSPVPPTVAGAPTVDAPLQAPALAAAPEPSPELPARPSEELDASIQQIMAAAPAIEPAPAVTSPAAAPAPADAHDHLPGDIAELETSPTPPAPRSPGFLRRIENAITGSLLLLAQLLDMPFAWLNDLDKNILGVIAFLLLLSGCLLYGLSVYYH